MCDSQTLLLRNFTRFYRSYLSGLFNTKAYPELKLQFNKLIDSGSICAKTIQYHKNTHSRTRQTLLSSPLYLNLRKCNICLGKLDPDERMWSLLIHSECRLGNAAAATEVSPLPQRFAHPTPEQLAALFRCWTDSSGSESNPRPTCTAAFSTLSSSETNRVRLENSGCACMKMD